MTVIVVLTGSRLVVESLSLSWAGRSGESARTEHASRSPAQFLEPMRIRAEHNLKACVINRWYRGPSRDRVGQRQILQDSINVAFFRQPDFVALRSKSDAGVSLRKSPRQK